MNQLVNPPKFTIGDTIYWVCDDDQRVHHAKVLFVNYALVGNHAIDVSYEVLDECNGPAVTRFIDECDAEDRDLSNC